MIETAVARPSSSLNLRCFPEPILRQLSLPVEVFDAKLTEIIHALFGLFHQHHGIGLAAPQAGIPLRLIVMEVDGRPLALANPKVVAAYGSSDLTEDCLSLPGAAVRVTRSRRITLEAYDAGGQGESFSMTGLWARLVQHELDHLNGVLISDYQDPATEDRSSGERVPPPWYLDGGMLVCNSFRPHRLKPQAKSSTIPNHHRNARGAREERRPRRGVIDSHRAPSAHSPLAAV